MRLGSLAAMVVAMLLTANPAIAQLDAPHLSTVPLHHDSGMVASRAAQRQVVWSDVIHIDGAATIRLYFKQLTLGKAIGDVSPTVLRLTSLHDGGQQMLDADAARQWGLSSAWFNGDTVLLELVADPSAPPSRVRLSHAESAIVEPGNPRSLCGTDDRVLSNDVRIGRVIPNGCTVWLINDANHCMLTAGHCAATGFDVIEFNYPPSDSDGIWQHAHPDDQYIIDATSIQSINGGAGNDWAYFGCFANPQTDRTPYEAQGDAFELVMAAPTADGRVVRVTGNGTTDGSVPPQMHRAQKTHTGALVGSAAQTLTYTVDTTGGNSGSPIIDEATGEAIGIHTHGGCTSGGGANLGTVITHPAVQAALANPLGVCAPPEPSLKITFPGGVPSVLDPDGASVIVHITPMHGGQLVNGSAMLHLDTGSGFIAHALTNASGNAFHVEMPQLNCADSISFYISAQVESKTAGSTIVTAPNNAPVQVYTALAAGYLVTALADNGEFDLGWTVENTQPITGGSWQRGVPTGGGDRGDPRTDYDGSGACWATELPNGNTDVDGGPTRLLSPVLDLEDYDDPVITYARWFYTDTPGGLEHDRFEMELSDDGGQSWVSVDYVILPTPWTVRSYRIADHVELTETVRVRFSVFDVSAASIVEAAVDAIHIFDIECEQPPFGDITRDGAIDVFDLLEVLAAWGACEAPCPPNCPADITNAAGDGSDCTVDIFDLLAVLASWSS